jgi:hypothetical protein
MKRVDILHIVKRQVIIWVAILVASMGLAILTTVSSDANQDYVKLDIKSFDTPESHVIASNGDRGAAIARLEDGRFLLGGGKSGFNLYIYDLADNSEKLLGKVAPAKERFDDSRFAISFHKSLRVMPPSVVRVVTSSINCGVRASAIA